MKTPNAELAYTVLDLINLNRNHFNMSSYVSTPAPVGLSELTESMPEDEDEPGDCGTTGCFAGWTAAVLGFKVTGEGAVLTADGEVLDDEIEGFAADRLGIGEHDAEYLFYVDDEEIDGAVADVFGPRPGGAS